MDRENVQTLAPFIQLAPMEGVLDWTLRELLSDVGGLDRMVTEFVRVTDRLLPDHVFKKYSPELDQGGKTRAGTPVFVQLLGGQPQPMAENAAAVTELGAPGIDLNFGCPAKTVNRHDGGAALLKIPQRLFDVTSAVRKAVRKDIPVTTKVRLGFEHKDFCREIAQACEEAGSANLVVHARTKLEMYQPPAHWEFIARMREGRKIPFVTNGDIYTADDYFRAIAASGVPHVALGRGIVRNPLLAWEIRKALDPELVLPEYSAIDFLRRFHSGTVAARGEMYALARIKQMLRYWSLAKPEHKLWFDQVKLMKTPAEVVHFL